MLGYYGHWPRLKFGMVPQEGGIVEGKAQALEPALVTTFLKARDDGAIEHKAEFLDTGAGQIAAKLFTSKAGGFSSAIDQIKNEFYGFDYVLEPNYSTNRGYALALDAIGADGEIALDAIYAAEYGAQTRAAMLLLDGVSAAYDALAKSMQSLQAENEQLLSLLASKRGAAVALDAAGVSPILFSGAATGRFIEDAERFHREELPKMVVQDREITLEDARKARALDSLLQRFRR
jgi:hypothetical protein